MTTYTLKDNMSGEARNITSELKKTTAELNRVSKAADKGRTAIKEIYGGPMKIEFRAARDRTKKFNEEAEKTPGIMALLATQVGKASKFLSGMTTGVASMAAGLVSKLHPALMVAYGLFKIGSTVMTVFAAAATSVAIVLGTVAFGAMQAWKAFAPLERRLQAMTGHWMEYERLAGSAGKIAMTRGSVSAEGAFGGAGALRGAGFNEALTAAALGGVGNALQGIGAPSSALDAVIPKLVEISNSAIVTREQIVGLLEIMPNVGAQIEQGLGGSLEQIEELGTSGRQFILDFVAALEDTPQSALDLGQAWENVSDGIRLALKQIGQAGEMILVPFLQNVGTMLDNLVGSGMLKDMARDWAVLFGSDVQSGAGVIATVLSHVLAFFKILPFVLKTGLELLKEAADWVINAVNKFIAAFNAISPVNIPSLEMLGDIALSASGLSGLEAQYKGYQQGFLDTLTKGGSSTAVAAGSPGFTDTALSRARRGLDGASAEGAATDGALLSAANRQVDLLSDIRDMERQRLSIDFRRYALGGGQLASIGVTAVERASMRGDEVGGIAQAIEKAMVGAFNQGLLSAKQNGAV